jgi:hypothetical protein
MTSVSERSERLDAHCEEWGSERSEDRGSSHDEAAERVFERAGAREQQ